MTIVSRFTSTAVVFFIPDNRMHIINTSYVGNI